MRTTKVFAPAKVNLTLHVTGQREDGYHLLDSLVAFAPVGDQITIQDANTLSLTVEGPEAANMPADKDNLVMRAAAIIAEGRGAAITLTKNLPVAAGIGGGSADAAATVRGLLAHWHAGERPNEVMQAQRPYIAALLDLGADIPMCLASECARVQGIGEDISRVTPLGPIPAVMVNPRVAISTPEVFRTLAQKNNSPMPALLPKWQNICEFAGWTQEYRNDLQAPAISLAPEIGEAIAALDQTEGALLTRMSGSGATCFAIYPDLDSTQTAAGAIMQDHPDWWVTAGHLGDQSKLAMPQVV